MLDPGPSTLIAHCIAKVWMHHSSSILDNVMLCYVKLQNLSDKEAITLSDCLILQGETPIDLAPSHDDSQLASVLSNIEHQAHA